MKVLRFLYVVFFLGFVKSELHKRQDAECNMVSAGIDAILEPCREGIERCYEAQDPEMNLVPLLCVPPDDIRRSRYDTLVRCQGQTIADQTFAAICGSPDCTNNSIPCNPEPEDRCFVRQLAEDSVGVAAFETCCTNYSTSDNCTNECRSQLMLFVDRVGCCTLTTPYIFYFDTCGGGATLQSLYSSCGVELPPPCGHPFSGPRNSGVTSFARKPHTVILAILVTLMISVWNL